MYGRGRIAFPKDLLTTPGAVRLFFTALAGGKEKLRERCKYTAGWWEEKEKRVCADEHSQMEACLPTNDRPRHFGARCICSASATEKKEKKKSVSEKENKASTPVSFDAK